MYVTIRKAFILFFNIVFNQPDLQVKVLPHEKNKNHKSLYKYSIVKQWQVIDHKSIYDRERNEHECLN